MPASSQIPINRSKLYPPDSSPDLVSRERLLASNQFGVGGRVTLVSAPAGYGKSTYIGQCINATGVSCAWVSLDPEDSDLRRFLTYVVAALMKVALGAFRIRWKACKCLHCRILRTWL